MLINPVVPTWERDLTVLKGLDLKLAFTVETHIHVDHITSALHLKWEVGSRIAYATMSRVTRADLLIEDTGEVRVGAMR